MQTQLLGQSVRHDAFGKGVITELSGGIVTIHFSQGDKSFVYPEAFSNFLTLKDPAKQQAVTARHTKRLQAEEAAREKEREARDRRRALRTMKIAPNAQAAFNLTPTAARQAATDGIISTGCYLSGYSKGEPRIPNRMKPNTACLLTALPAGGTERDRQILGAFMVSDGFWGEHCKDGIVRAHPQHRLLLPAGADLPYWSCFDGVEPLPRWGNVVFKYFANTTMQQILFDMTGLLSGTPQEDTAQAFYQYFSQINRLPALQKAAEVPVL